MRDVLLQKNLTNDNIKIIHAKRYASRVGVRAIQEISSAKDYYKAD